jgi:proline iminopeptidase
MTNTQRSAVVITGLLACLTTTAVSAPRQALLPDPAAFVDVDGARLFVRSAGAGAPIVVVHGGPGMSHDYLAPQLIELLAGEYRLIFYDQRGSGRSSGVEDPARLTMAQFVDDLERLRQALGLEQLTLLGHSFGGLLAMYYAAERPEAVSRLLLVDTSPASWQLNFPPIRKAIAERQTQADREAMASLVARSGARSDPATMDRYYKLYFRAFFNDPTLSDRLELGIDPQWLANNAITNDRVWASIGEYDIHDRLRGITARTLILHGTRSVISMEGAEAIAAHIPTSRLIRLQDVGHFPYVEAPQPFAAAVQAFVW